MWDLLIIQPMVNALLVLYGLLGQNFLVAITVFTILIKIITLPLNLRQQRASMRMQEMQPQIQAIQKKYRDNPQKMNEEFQKIGYSPAESLTGCLPLLIQMPILFGLFQVIRLVLGANPQSLLDLNQYVYTGIGINLAELLPISNRFLWLNLAQPDPYLALPLLVAGTMYISQKFLTPPPKTGADGKPRQDDPTVAMTQSMTYTMPIMFGFFSLNFPSGLSIYFILSNVLSVFQGMYMRRIMPPTQPVLANNTVDGVANQIEDTSEAPRKDAQTNSTKQGATKRKNRSAKK